MFFRFLLLALVFSQTAFALNIQLFRPKGDRDGALHNFSSGTLKPGVIQAGAYFSYASKPAELGGAVFSENIETLMTLDTVLNIGLTDFLSFGINVPFNLDSKIIPLADTTGEEDYSLGDMLLHATLQFKDNNKDGFGLALVPYLSIPLNDVRTDYFNDAGYLTGATWVTDLWIDNTYLSSNLGAHYRFDEEVIFINSVDQATVGNEASYGLSLAQYFGSQKNSDVFVEFFGRTPLDSPFQKMSLSPMELVLGLRHRLIDQSLLFTMGAGKGLNSSYASPDYRVFAGLMIQTGGRQVQPKAAVEEIEELPIPAAPLATPAAKPKVGQLVIHVRDENNKALKANLTIVEVTGGGQYTDETELWRKNIKPGIYEITARAEGYVTSNKKVTLRPNKRFTDKVVLEKEVKEGEKIEVLGKILFDSGKASIQPSSASVLDDVAGILERHPEIQKLRIEAHSDSVGAAAFNRKLSTERAASVLQALIGRGVDPSRLVSVGLGEAQPIATNDTPQGRALNRRVEFTILKSSGNSGVKVQR